MECFLTRATSPLHGGGGFLGGQKISLRTLMEDAGFADEEFEFLTEAKRRSDKLVELEETAMNALSGRRQAALGASFSMPKRSRPPGSAAQRLSALLRMKSPMAR